MPHRMASAGAALAAVAVLAALAAAQPPATQPATQPADQRMSMHDMMMRCTEHCRATRESSEQTRRLIEQAQASNDPAARRAALDQAQQQLQGVQERMSACMNMMQEMHGGMMRGVGGGPGPGGGGGMVQGGSEGMSGMPMGGSTGASPDMEQMAKALTSMAQTCEMMMQKEMRAFPYIITAAGILGVLILTALVLFIVLARLAT